MPIIQDISLAPRNARGMVEYSTNIELLKPADMARGNRMLLFEVNNRGNKLAVAAFNEGVAGRRRGSQRAHLRRATAG